MTETNATRWVFEELQRVADELGCWITAATVGDMVEDLRSHGRIAEAINTMEVDRLTDLEVLLEDYRRLGDTRRAESVQIRVAVVKHAIGLLKGGA